MSRLAQFIYIVLLPFLVSLGIYLAFRTDATIVNVLASKISILGHTRSYLCHLGLSKTGNLSYFFVYVFPGALWLASVMAISTGISYEKKGQKYFLMVLPLLYGIGIEISQYFHFTDGTFDWGDMLAVPFACLLGYFLGKKCFDKNLLPLGWGVFLLVLAFLSLFMADVV